MGAIASVKDFLLHMLMITLGLLIALALDGLREELHHRELAHEARSNFAAELQGNRALVER
jgi:hypothetical protein